MRIPPNLSMRTKIPRRESSRFAEFEATKRRAAQVGLTGQAGVEGQPQRDFIGQLGAAGQTQAQAQAQKSKQAQRTAEALMSGTGISEVEALAQPSESIFVQGIAQAQAQDQAQAQAQAQALMNPLQPRATARGRAPRGAFPFLLPTLETQRAKKKARAVKGAPGYNVFTRQRGKPVRINPEPLDRMSALGFGADITDNTTDASFTIKRSKQAATAPKNERWGSLSHKFRPRKTRHALELVEKEKFRIDSMGEMLGLKAAPRRKKKRGFR